MQGAQLLEMYQNPAIPKSQRTHTKEAKLLEQLRQHNRKALERVMQRYTNYVGTILRNILREQATQKDLEELTVDVFLSLWNHAPEMRTENLSAYHVHTRVVAQLELEDKEKHSSRRFWKFGRILAILTAAVVLVSSTAITAAAASGGFHQLFEMAFGKETKMPEALDGMYTVPDVIMEDTCDGMKTRIRRTNRMRVCFYIV